MSEYHRHGLTGEAKRQVFDALFQKQQGRCALCSISQEELDAKYPRHAPVYRKFIIDHCHSTGKIRGLLCNPCNNLLGMMETCAQYETELHWYPRFDGWLERNQDVIHSYLQDEVRT